MDVNATSNLFSSSSNTTSEIDGRIFDDDEDASKPEVIFEPFLLSNIPIECPDDCSGVGTCVFPGYCICEEGWAGDACSDATCQALDFCSGHGSCVGYNTCNCDEGWLDATCNRAECIERLNCNGNGKSARTRR